MIKYRIVFSDTALTEMKNLYSQILQLSSSTYTALNYVEAMRYEINKDTIRKHSHDSGRAFMQQ